MSKKIKGIDDLQHDPNNANKGNERGRKAVDDSLTKYGAGRSIVVDQNGVVIGGNKTLDAAKAAGIDIEIIKTKGDKLVVVQREDLDLLNDHKARKLAYADNRAGELGLDWDLDQIKADLDAGMILDDMFSLDELGDMGVDLPTLEPEEAPEAQMDAAEELQAKWKVQRGDVWEIGEHRLMCGDNIKDAALFLDGNSFDICLTDPPYGVGYGYASHDDSDMELYWSLMEGLISIYKSFCDLLVCFVGNKNNNQWFSRFNPDSFLVWYDKTKQSPHKVAYLCKSELCLVFGKPKERWNLDTLEVNGVRGDGLRELHTCPKPVELFEKLIEKECYKFILDPFLGSGTTMVAAERLGRKCYGMEIEPKYCAVILERMQQMGLEPELVENHGSEETRD